MRHRESPILIIWESAVVTVIHAKYENLIMLPKIISLIDFTQILEIVKDWYIGALILSIKYTNDALHSNTIASNHQQSIGLYQLEALETNKNSYMTGSASFGAKDPLLIFLPLSSTARVSACIFTVIHKSLLLTCCSPLQIPCYGFPSISYLRDEYMGSFMLKYLKDQ